MSILDTDMLTEVQFALTEDAAFSSGLWTPTEVIGYFNQRQYRFLKETMILGAVATLPWTPQEPYGALPTDWVMTIRALWHDFVGGRYTPLTTTDTFELDHTDIEGATTAGLPLGYRDADVPGTLLMGLGPAPSAPGEVELVYVSLSELLDGTGQLFDTPDDFVPYIKYGVYADMLGKDGRGQDLLRARYAEQRFSEGVALTQALLGGW